MNPAAWAVAPRLPSGALSPSQHYGAIENDVATEYAVITPARDEARFLPDLIADMVAQTLRPVQWIVVDDGSGDGTPLVVRDAASRHDWIRLIQMARRQDRLPGPGVVRAFNTGLESIDLLRVQFIVKLDADVRLPPTYFEAIIAAFKQRPHMGIAGGVCVEDGNVVAGGPRYHVRGATKVYRTQCFVEIGGLVPLLPWDGIDEISAIAHGWETETIHDISFEHRRPAGSHADAGGRLHACFREGRGSYIRRSLPLFAFLRAGHLAIRAGPVGGLAALLGYLSGFLVGAERVHDRQIVTVQRLLEWQRLRGALDVAAIARSRRARKARGREEEQRSGGSS